MLRLFHKGRQTRLREGDAIQTRNDHILVIRDDELLEMRRDEEEAICSFPFPMEGSAKRRAQHLKDFFDITCGHEADVVIDSASGEIRLMLRKRQPAVSSPATHPRLVHMRLLHQGKPTTLRINDFMVVRPEQDRMEFLRADGSSLDILEAPSERTSRNLHIRIKGYDLNNITWVMNLIALLTGYGIEIVKSDDGERVLYQLRKSAIEHPPLQLMYGKGKTNLRAGDSIVISAKTRSIEFRREKESLSILEVPTERTLPCLGFDAPDIRAAFERVLTAQLVSLQTGLILKLVQKDEHETVYELITAEEAAPL